MDVAFIELSLYSQCVLQNCLSLAAMVPMAMPRKLLQLVAPVGPPGLRMVVMMLSASGVAMASFPPRHYVV